MCARHYQREAIRRWGILVSIGINRIAVLQTDDSFGADSVIGAEKGFAAANIKPVLLQKFPRDKADFAALAAQVVRNGAQAVLYIGSSGTVASGVKALRAAGSSAQVVTPVQQCLRGFIKLLGSTPVASSSPKCFPTNARSISA